MHLKPSVRYAFLCSLCVVVLVFFFFLCISNGKLKVFDANSVVFRAQNKIHATPTDNLSASYSSVHAYLVRKLRYWFINIFYIIISTFGLSLPVLLMLNPLFSLLLRLISLRMPIFESNKIQPNVIQIWEQI